MTKLLEKAISRVRELPEDRQDELAEMLLGLAEEPEHLLTPEQETKVELAMHEGKVASKERMDALWKRFGH